MLGEAQPGESGAAAATPRTGNGSLDVIIVMATGDRDHIRACLESLERFPYTLGDMRVHVLDNASQDGAADVVEEGFPDVELRRMGWNAGFCIANNTGLAETSGEFALVLNPDTEFLEGSLDHLVRVLREEPDAGMIGPRLMRRDGTLDHAAKRSFPTPLSALGHFTGIGRRDGARGLLAEYRAPDLDEHAFGEVDAVNGAFMLARREAIESVGLFDEHYWLYMEDLDWCYRFRQRGWKVLYDGRTTVIHVKGGATVRKGHRGLRHNYAFHRGMARFYRKFYEGRGVLDAAVYLAIAVKFVVSAARSAVARRSVR